MTHHGAEGVASRRPLPRRNGRPSGERAPLRVLVVTGAYPTDPTPHSGTFIKSQVESLVAAGAQVEVIHPRPGPVLLRYAWAVSQVFLRTLTGRFDVVHGHYGLWCLVARMQWTTPVVASFLGDDLLGTPTEAGGQTRKSALVVQVSRWLCRYVDAVIVKSDEMKRAARCERAHVIPNGVDFDLFRPMPRDTARAALGWNPAGCYVLFGNDPRIPVKDYPLAQAAIRHLRSRGIAAELVVANGLPQTRVAQYMNGSNAVLLTSLHEGSPNIVKEAMACNIPVVATDVGDVRAVIGRTPGCHVCPRDPEALAAALEQALRYPAPTTGRTDIAHLNRSVVARQVMAVYADVGRARAKHLAPALQNR
jgi:teichuronic acid biosynthesis glycosyltransferase TuaC